jgi:hypothetical protein
MLFGSKCRIGNFPLHQIHQNTNNVGIAILWKSAFIGNETSNGRCQGSKPSGHVATDVIQGPIWENVILEKDCRKLHTRINGGAHRTSQWIPHHVIKPSKELFGAIVIQILYMIC